MGFDLFCDLFLSLLPGVDVLTQSTAKKMEGVNIAEKIKFQPTVLPRRHVE